MEIPASTKLIDGLTIGHATVPSGKTGCTVVLCPAGAVGGVAVHGGAPGTRETDLLRPENWVDRVHAVVLTGGSAFGLACVEGVMRWLAERGYGWPTAASPVPIVPAAVLYDLRVGQLEWPDAELGYTACEGAGADTPAEGRIGAGAGATVGKVLGPGQSSLGGIGTATLQLGTTATVGAIVAVNAMGHIVDAPSGRILAGPRLPGGEFGDTIELLLQPLSPPHPAPQPPAPGTNTTIGVVWTDAQLTKADCKRVAVAAHDGLARAIRPAHTLYDGDTLFVLSLPDASANAPRRAPDRMLIEVAAAEVVAHAIRSAVVH
jgi:L-aminopeptidase/D-esterase-like protein